MAIEKDQSQEKGKSSEIGSLNDIWESEFFDKALEAVEEESSEEKVLKPKESKEAKMKGEEEECAECPDKKKAKETEKKEPYKVLKIQGKEVPVYSEEELIELAQKGMDYTKKTQSVSEERKGIEVEREELRKQHTELLEAINKGKGEGQEGIQPQKEKEMTEAELYKKYGIDEEYAEDWQKKIILDVAGIKKEKDQLKEQNQRLSEAYQYMMLDGMLKSVKDAVNKARVEYPIEEIIEDEKNLTQDQFMSMFSSKIQDKNNKNKPIPDLAVETLKEIHALQRRSQEKANQEQGINEENLTPEDFKTRFPKLYAKIAGTVGENAVVDYLKERESLPPSLESKPRDVEFKKSETKKDLSLDERLDLAFADPDILEAVKGG